MEFSRRDFLKFVAATPLLSFAGDGYVHLTGSFSFGEGIELFLPDGSDLALWIAGDGSVLSDLQNFYYKNTSTPYESINITVKGLCASCNEGEHGSYAADSDGLLYIESWKPS